MLTWSTIPSKTAGTSFSESLASKSLNFIKIMESDQIFDKKNIMFQMQQSRRCTDHPVNNVICIFIINFKMKMKMHVCTWITGSGFQKYEKFQSAIFFKISKIPCMG